jgi:hypothetical protein
MNRFLHLKQEIDTGVANLVIQQGEICVRDPAITTLITMKMLIWRCESMLSMIRRTVRDILVEIDRETDPTIESFLVNLSKKMVTDNESKVTMILHNLDFHYAMMKNRICDMICYGDHAIPDSPVPDRDET